MVADSFKKVKEWCKENHKDLFIAGIIFCTGLSSFGLGRLSVDLKPNSPLVVTDSAANPPMDQHTVPNASIRTDKRVAASRNGTAYYFPWCAGLLRIKEENKVWFPTKEAAEIAGLTLAGNCRGL